MVGKRGKGRARERRVLNNLGRIDRLVDISRDSSGCGQTRRRRRPSVARIDRGALYPRACIPYAYFVNARAPFFSLSLLALLRLALVLRRSRRSDHSSSKSWARPAGSVPPRPIRDRYPFFISVSPFREPPPRLRSPRWQSQLQLHPRYRNPVAFSFARSAN